MFFVAGRGCYAGTTVLIFPIVLFRIQVYPPVPLRRKARAVDLTLAIFYVGGTPGGSMVTASLPDPALNLIVDDTSVETTVRCRGRIVSSTADLLKATIRPLILDQKTIWLDLSDVTYMDSSGLGAVVGLFVTARRVKAYLKLINMSPQIRQLFSITKLGEFFIEGQDPDYPESPVRQPR